MRTIALAAAVFMATAAQAEVFKVAVPQKGAWETGIVYIGDKAGLFKAEGIEIDPLYTRGGAETVQAVLSGSVDLAVANGILGTIGSYSRGAPIRITAASMTGTPEVYWYVRGDSDIKSVKDLAGKSLGFSQQGSSTHLIVLEALKHFGVNAKVVPSGTPPTSYTMVMSKQIDAGWAVPPFNLERIAKGEVRIIFTGLEVPSLQQQTTRVHVTNANALKSKRDLLVRFHRALQKSLDFAYADDRALEIYAPYGEVDVATARTVRDKFHPKANMQMSKINDLDRSLQQALDFKFLDKAAKAEDMKGLIDILVP